MNMTKYIDVILLVLLFSFECYCKENTLITGYGMEYPQKERIKTVVDKAILDPNTKCIIIFDKSIKDYYHYQINNNSCYLISIFIQNLDTTKLVFLDEENIYKPIILKNDSINFGELELTGFYFEEICDYQNQDFISAYIGISSFTLIYVDHSKSFYFTIDNDLEPIECDFQERFKVRVSYKKFIRGIIDKYTSKMK